MTKTTPTPVIGASPEPLVYKYSPDARVGIDLPVSAWLTIMGVVVVVCGALAKVGWKCYLEHTRMARKVENIDDTTNQLLSEQKVGFKSLNENVSKLDVRLSIFGESMENLKKEIKRLELTLESVTDEIQNQKIEDEKLKTKIIYIEEDLRQIKEALDKYSATESKVAQQLDRYSAAEIKVDQQQKEIERQQEIIEEILKRIENFKECMT